MSSFEAQIEKSRKEVAEAQSKITELSGKIETARTKMAQGTDITLDIENASLEDVHAHSDMMNANIAELILGLDDVTAGFSKDFDSMRSKTGWEKFVGIFSKKRSEMMRQERIRVASIEDKLQDLIGKSNTIGAMLQSQLDELGRHKNQVETNLQNTLAERGTTLEELTLIRDELKTLDPEVIALEGKLAAATDANERSKLESELATVNARYNELVQLEQVKLGGSQTLELYDALSKSLKTAQQQDVAHQINEIGVATDKEAQVAMAAIGAATNTRMAEMMESHEDHIVFARKVLEEKVKADERFARRFEKIVEMHDKNAYGEGSLG